SAPSLNLMPQPSSLSPGTGALPIDANFSIAFTGYTEPRLHRAADRFLNQLRRQTGLLINKTAPESRDAATPILIVRTNRASKKVQDLGEDESYSLEVTATGAKLNAANPLGVL